MEITKTTELARRLCAVYENKCGIERTDLASPLRNISLSGGTIVYLFRESKFDAESFTESFSEWEKDLFDISELIHNENHLGESLIFTVSPYSEECVRVVNDLVISKLTEWKP